MTEHVSITDPSLLLDLGELGVAVLGLLVALAALGCVHALITTHRGDRS